MSERISYTARLASNGASLQARPNRAAQASRPRARGGIAQLGERLHGMQEVSGSIPLTSTKSEPASLK